MSIFVIHKHSHTKKGLPVVNGIQPQSIADESLATYDELNSLNKFMNIINFQSEMSRFNDNHFFPMGKFITSFHFLYLHSIMARVPITDTINRPSKCSRPVQQLVKSSNNSCFPRLTSNFQLPTESSICTMLEGYSNVSFPFRMDKKKSRISKSLKK